MMDANLFTEKDFQPRYVDDKLDDYLISTRGVIKLMFQMILENPHDCKRTKGFGGRSTGTGCYGKQ